MAELLYVYQNVLWDIPNCLLEKYRRWSQKNRQQKFVEEEEEEEEEEERRRRKKKKKKKKKKEEGRRRKKKIRIKSINKADILLR